jgi:hypothetical protein
MVWRQMDTDDTDSLRESADNADFIFDNTLNAILSS